MRVYLLADISITEKAEILISVFFVYPVILIITKQKERGLDMCLITFRIANHPKYKLILAANRDEAYARPTEMASFWSEHPQLLAGKDLEANGTWLGITKDGRIAAITNCHEGTDKVEQITYTADSPKKSRGKIITDYLLSKKQPEIYLHELIKEKHAYQPFNILLGNADALYHFNSQEESFVQLHKGTHSISNASLDIPWPKVRKTKKQIDRILKGEDHYIESLFEMMMDQIPARDDELQYAAALPLDLRRKTSAPFIKTEGFGTRSTTLLLVDYDDQVTFLERTYKKNDTSSDQMFHFKIGE